MNKSTAINPKNLLKFILCSAFGVLMFLVPIPQGESFTTLLDFLKTGLKNFMGVSMNYIIVAIMIVSAVMGIIDLVAKPDFIRKNSYMSKAFHTTPFYLGSKILGAVFACMVVFGFGPEAVTSADTGVTMLDLCNTLLCIVVSFSFILPFLTDCGSMEVLGVLLRPVVRPLFRVPGRASVDLIGETYD